MKKVLAVVSILALACSALALADEEEKIDIEGPPEEGQALLPCATDGYKQYSVTAGLPVPDNNATGVASTLTLTETGTIVDVVVGFKMGHTYIGDLVAGLSFQPACGGPVIGPVRLICRQNRVNCTGLGSPFGCSNDLLLANNYEWSDAAAAEASEPCLVSPTILPSGCYLPDNDNGFAALSVFDGLDKAGCWTLSIQDMGGGDTGTLVSWTLSLDNSEAVSEACCYPDGTCEDAVLGGCPAGSTGQGGGTSCATVQCVDTRPRGACCYVNGNCDDGILQTECEANGGTSYPGDNCANVACTNAVESKSWGNVKGLFR